MSNQSNVVELPSVIAQRKRDRQENVIIVMGMIASLVVGFLRFKGLL